jgi:hypothetical protein
MIYVKVIHEYVSDHPYAGRLGRHIEHDEMSRNYAVEADRGVQYKSVLHRRYGGVLDQGQLGSCTGNACAGVINTLPVHVAGAHTLKETDAVALYELATALDNIPGSYPPDDTGSSGLAVAKAAQQKGYITSYNHAFSLDAALQALQLGPVITGINWYEGFDQPDTTKHGLVEISGQIRGGHEIEILGFELMSSLMDSLLIAENSWGNSWGVKGRFCFTVATWRTLLDQQGDCTIL